MRWFAITSMRRNLGFSAVISLVSVALSVLATYVLADPEAPSGYLISVLVPALVAPPVSVLAGWNMLRLHQATEQLKYLVDHDAMTGLLVRGAFFREAEALRGSVCAMYLLDIDHFKSINDRYGHAVGDKVIIAVGEYLQTLGAIDAISARFGGEEFAVLAPLTSEETAAAIGERIVRELEQTVVSTPEYGDIAFTVSAGLCMLKSGDDIDLILVAADTALYQAKSSGRNRLCVAPAQSGITRILSRGGARSLNAPASPFADRLPPTNRGTARKPA